ncbi:hypothetical protein IJH66_01225 [Candidatus Saccharibacteria bacterium]|nr:hypothetical protein [Candidatus Saccharibacteria bacterium]
MEEKRLYFEPEFSGNKKHKKEKSKKGEHKFLKLFFFLLFLLIMVLIIIWLLRGSKTVSGQYPANVKNEALICESEEIAYSKITKAISDNKNLKINILFDSDNKLKNASLIYTLYYDNEDEVKRAEAFAHAEFNLGLNDNGYSSSKFNNKFARYPDRLIISLFANSSDIDEYTAQYFMINQEEYHFPETISEYKKMYDSQGFSCESTEE